MSEWTWTWQDLVALAVVIAAAGLSIRRWVKASSTKSCNKCPLAGPPPRHEKG